MGSIELLAQERRARMAAERLLEQRQNELFAANAELSKHALTLTGEIIEKREEVAVVRVEAEDLRGQNTQVLQDLKQANHAVDIAERRLWDSVETVEDGFAVFDRSHRMIAANSAYLSVFDGLDAMTPGVSYHDMLTLMTEEGIVDTDGLSRADWVSEQLNRWNSQDLPIKTLRLWNGQFIKLVDRRSDNGDTVSLALNITDTIEREEQLKDARRTAEAANRAKSAFLAKMSHELRTPMNGVVGMADLLVETPLDDEQQLFVDTIKSSGEALLELINNVLDFSKMEAEKLVLHTQEFDLEQILTEVLMLFQPAVLTKNLELIIDYDLFMPTCFVGDPGRIRQILTNLIGNAVKFTTTGHVLIRVVGMPAGNTKDFRIHITVEDTGLGIPEEMVGHIFGEFNQVEDEKNRSFEGTGLGLAISKQLVELMHGEIWVDSEEGIGSSFGFHLTLPAPKGPGNVEPLPDWIGRIIVQSAPNKSASILAKQLAVLGAEIVELTPEETREYTNLRNVSMVIIDTDGADDIGLKTISHLKKSATDTPIIVLQSLQAGQVQPAHENLAYLNKPVGRWALVHAICELVPPTGRKQNETPTKPLELRKMRILAAEDNRTNRLVFSKLVGKLNVELEFAENGQEAVEKWQNFQPDMIFMDISMPVMDGKEATAQIRAIEVEKHLRHTPIIALTAHAMDGDDNDILLAGLDHYLTKPLRKPAIFDQIKDAVPAGAEAVFDDLKTAVSGA